MSDDFRSQVNAARADIERHIEDARAQFDATQERINKRSGRNLFGAIGIGLFLGAVLVLSLFLMKELFILFALALIVLAAFELAAALRHGGYLVPAWASAVGSGIVLPLVWFGGISAQMWGVLAAIALVIVARLVLHVAGHRSERGLLADIGAAAFVQGYVTLLGSFAVLLTAQEGGQWWTFVFIVVVILTDTGAYVSGLLWGKHKMAPVISPKKTWEGFVGGAVASLVGGVLFGAFVLDIGWLNGLIMALAIFLTATLGDLTESLIKRDLGIKDMSSFLPGHGGFLDRLDSILPSAAVAFVCYQLMVG